MSAKIEVFSKPLTGLESGPQHMYIIYTNEAGVKNIMRGGPEGSSFANAMIGDIAVEDLPYAKYKPDGTNQLDWDEGNTHIGQEIFTGTDAEMYAKIDAARAEMVRINTEGYDYNLPLIDTLIAGWGGANDQNSNTVVTRLAEVMGLKPLVLNFITTNSLSVPGYDATLEHSLFERTTESLYQGLKDSGHTVSELWSSSKSFVGNAYEGVQDFFFGLFAREGEVIVGPLQQIDNSILDLNIRTDKLEGFSSNQDTTQVGNWEGDNMKKAAKLAIVTNPNGETIVTGVNTAQNIFKNVGNFFSNSLRVFASVVFCLGIFLRSAYAYPDFWPTDSSVSEFIKSRTKLDITTQNLISELIARHKLDPVNKPKDQCELMNKIAEYVQLSTLELGSMGAISSENSEVYITPYRIVKSEKVYQNGVFEDEDKFNSELIYLVRDGFGRPVGVSRLFTKPFAKKSGYYKILQNHRKASEGNNSLQELVFVDQKPLNSSYLKINNCYINEIHLTMETVYLGMPARYNQ